ncbi:MAG: hypothetical protein DRJ49_03465 [Thermoprotei archaeon]|nr:MAG: hypothetical protein DRJ49_03465 [Thermoprotei archaeon]
MPLKNKVYLLLTTISGLEDVLIEEISELYGNTIEILESRRGWIIASIDSNSPSTLIDNLIASSRSLERIYTILFRTKLEIDCIKTAIESTSIHSMFTPYTKFAIKLDKEKYVDVDSYQLVRILGDLVCNTIEKRKGYRPIVSLDNPDIEIYCKVFNRELIFAFDITGPKALHFREWRVYLHPSTLNAIIAYAMARLSKAKTATRVLDPMCGSGTILIETGLAYSKPMLYGMDINIRHVEGTLENIRRAGLESRCTLKVGDALSIREYFDLSFDRIITNPPYGIRELSYCRTLYELYEGFMKSALEVLTGNGYITLITPRRRLMKSILRKFKLKVVKRKDLEHGGIRATIFVLTSY